MNYVDPEGQKVSAVFNRYTHTLYITDLDHYKKGLPEKFVSAREYQLGGGVRDKEGRLIQNQVLVINNVFSGGQIENGKILRDVNDNRQIAIPIATYDIVDNNADTKLRGWFRLDRQDNSLFNDKDEMLTDCEYSSMRQLPNGNLLVTYNGKSGILNTDGEKIVECKYSDLDLTENGDIRITITRIDNFCKKAKRLDCYALTDANGVCMTDYI